MKDAVRVAVGVATYANGRTETWYLELGELGELSWTSAESGRRAPSVGRTVVSAVAQLMAGAGLDGGAEKVVVTGTGGRCETFDVLSLARLVSQRGLAWVERQGGRHDR